MHSNQKRMEAKIGTEEIDSNQGKAEACHREMKTMMNVHQERMEAKMDAWLEEMA
jgi:hypothetical protein